MTKFERAYVPPEEIVRSTQNFVEQWKIGKPEIRQAFNTASPELAEQMIRAYFSEFAEEVIYKNDRYQVNVRELADNITHLSIKRIDKKPIHDWRDLQEIKNQIMGPEFEAIELYPAESRRVDSANQYHLWAVRDPSWRFPVGFSTRFVSEDSINGSVQRPFQTA